MENAALQTRLSCSKHKITGEKSPRQTSRETWGVFGGGWAFWASSLGAADACYHVLAQLACSTQHISRPTVGLFFLHVLVHVSKQNSKGNECVPTHPANRPPIRHKSLLPLFTRVGCGRQVTLSVVACFVCFAHE